MIASCPAGTTALTGGASTLGAEGDVGISESRPGPENPSTTWHGSAREVVDTGATWQLRVDVVCGEVSGYERLSISVPPSTEGTQIQFDDPSLECPDGKQVISGGAGFSGADLRQVLWASLVKDSLVGSGFETFWQGSATDYGSTTSQSPWSIEAETICSDATRFEGRFDTLGPDSQSPKSYSVNCQGGKVPVGGGAQTVGGGDLGFLRSSRPKDAALPGGAPIGWSAEAQSEEVFWSLDVQATCAPRSEPTLGEHGLLGRWAGEWDAYDSFGWANGTLPNGVGFAPGVNGTAFSFDGTSDQWLSLPSFVANNGSNVIDLYPESDFTFSAWIRMDTLPAPGASAMIAGLYDFGARRFRPTARRGS